jgi:hypothetical protein
MAVAIEFQSDFGTKTRLFNPEYPALLGYPATRPRPAQQHLTPVSLNVITRAIAVAP